jgi:hypothetical protein
MKPDGRTGQAATPEFEEKTPFPFRGLSLAISTCFALIVLIAAIAWNPQALAILLPAAISAANWWGNHHVRGSAEGLDIQVRMGRLPVWSATILYSTIQEFKVCPLPFFSNPLSTVRFGHPMVTSWAVRLQLTRGPMSIPRPADVVYVGTSRPEELVAFLRTKVAQTQEPPPLPPAPRRLHYDHRQFCRVCVPFWVGTVGFAVLLLLRLGATGPWAGLINVLIGIGLWAFVTAALCTSYLRIKDDYTNLLVSYGPVPLARARLPYRQIVTVEEDWLDFFRIVWGALPGQPRCFIGRGKRAVRVTLSERRADLGHSREAVIGTNDPEGLIAFLRARIEGAGHGAAGAEA